MENKEASHKPKPGLTLSEQAFFILLSLASGRKHGYAILKDVEDLSGSGMHLSTSTLYAALGRMLAQGLIVRVSLNEAETPGPGLPRKFYELSDKGRRALEVETRRMQSIVLLAQWRLVEEEK